MQSKEKIFRSKVKSRKGEKDGIFQMRVKEIDFLDYAKSTQTTHQQLVVERLEYLKDFALNVLRERCGFASWSDMVLIVNGVHQHLPEGFEIDEYRQKLSSEGLDVSYTTARSSFDDTLSFGNFANYLDKACGAVEMAIEADDMFAALLNLSRAEEYYLDLHLLAMESDYVLGKSQRQTGGINWDAALREWEKQRPNFPNDAKCDAEICKKYGIRSPATVRSQRYTRGVKKR